MPVAKPLLRFHIDVCRRGSVLNLVALVTALMLLES